MGRGDYIIAVRAGTFLRQTAEGSLRLCPLFPLFSPYSHSILFHLYPSLTFPKSASICFTTFLSLNSFAHSSSLSCSVSFLSSPQSARPMNNFPKASPAAQNRRVVSDSAVCGLFLETDISVCGAGAGAPLGSLW